MSSVNLNNLSQDELNKILKEEYEKNKKLKKERSILLIKMLQKQNETLSQSKPKPKPKSRPKSKPKSKPKPKFKPKFKPKSKSKQKIKTFDEYFQECTQNKTIPRDTPLYLKKALERAMKEYDKGIKHEKSALSNFAEKYVIEGLSGLIPIEYFSEKATLIKGFLRNHRNTKVRMIMVCEMEKQIIEKSKTTYEQDNAYFQSRIHINLEKTEVKVFLKEMIIEILGNLIIYQRKGSGWYFKKVNSLEIHIVEYKPMKGSSFIPLPNFIMRKKAIINMENEDDKCFLWSILRYLHSREKHSTRINDLKKYENDLNFKEINFPVKVKDIQKFENNNPDLPGINVFSVNDNNKIYPLRINKKDCQKLIDLFLYSEDEKQHYSLIKNFSRLVRSQITKDTTRKLRICKKCLTNFTKENLLEKHISYCSKNETVAVKMPTKNFILKFKNHFKKLPLPFVIYADFECFTIPINSCQPNTNKSFSQCYQKHEPSGYRLYIKAMDGMKVDFKPIVYTKKTPDEDISKNFIKHVVKSTHQIYQDYYSKPKPYNLSSQEKKDFQSAMYCHICEQKLFRDKKTGKILKVRDHCHFTGEYRGAAHNECNLNCKNHSFFQ